MEQYPVNLLKKQAKLLFGVKIDRDRKDLFQFYHDQLIEWNSRLNLFPKGAKDYLYTNLFLDSISLFKYLPLKKNSVVVDIGSGNGCPGLPLKIIRWDLKLYLIESRYKRSIFLKTIAGDFDHVNIGDVQVLNQRAEETNLPEQADLVVTRAAIPFQELLAMGRNFLKIGGYLVSYSGVNSPEIVKEHKKHFENAKYQFVKLFNYKLPTMEQQRYLIILKYLGE